MYSNIEVARALYDEAVKRFRITLSLAGIQVFLTLALFAAVLTGCQTTSVEGSAVGGRFAGDEEFLGLTETYEWPVMATNMPAGRDTGGHPEQWWEFCLRRADFGSIDLAFCQTEPDVLTLTEDTWEALVLAQRMVNDNVAFTADADKDAPGRERWSVLHEKGEEGDCEDLALTKRYALIEAGAPPGALRLAQCRLSVASDVLPPGEGHAVLTVETDRGTWVMGAYGGVVPWDQSECDTYGYRWAGPTWEDLRDEPLSAS